MTMYCPVRTATVAAIAVLALSATMLPAQALAQTAPIVEDFASDRIGASPKSFSTPTGFWSIGTIDGSKPVLYEDGTQWSNANHSNALADQARALYGDRWTELIDELPETSYFPLAVFDPVENFTAGTIHMRYEIVGGDADQDFGILFNYLPNGDFMAMRADAQENSLGILAVSQGKQSTLTRAREVPVSFAQWHELQLISTGTNVTGWVDGIKYIDLTFDSPIGGRVGVYGKSDTSGVVDSFSVQSAE